LIARKFEKGTIVAPRDLWYKASQREEDPTRHNSSGYLLARIASDKSICGAPYRRTKEYPQPSSIKGAENLDSRRAGANDAFRYADEKPVLNDPRHRQKPPRELLGVRNGPEKAIEDIVTIIAYKS
jgi:hypothetical protein